MKKKNAWVVQSNMNDCVMLWESEPWRNNYGDWESEGDVTEFCKFSFRRAAGFIPRKGQAVEIEIRRVKR